MYYTQDEFFALLEAVEQDGGKWLNDELHEDVSCDLMIGPELLKKNKTNAIPYCNEMALFEVPYEPMGEHPDGTVAIIKVCAVDDWMGRWPRFASPETQGAA